MDTYNTGQWDRAETEPTHGLAGQNYTAGALIGGYADGSPVGGGGGDVSQYTYKSATVREAVRPTREFVVKLREGLGPDRVVNAHEWDVYGEMIMFHRQRSGSRQMVLAFPLRDIAEMSETAAVEGF